MTKKFKNNSILGVAWHQCHKHTQTTITMVVRVVGHPMQFKWQSKAHSITSERSHL